MTATGHAADHRPAPPSPGGRRLTTETPTAADICAALRRRYNKPSQGRPGEQYVCIEEARAGAGFDGNEGRCDFLALNTWKSRGLELIGHEIKVTLSDWRTERNHPEKAERFARYCRRWYVVAPAALAGRIAHDVPSGWGLMSVSAKGRVAEVHAAHVREPETVPEWWWLGWLAQVDRHHKRHQASLVEAVLADEREVLRKGLEKEVAEDAQLCLGLDDRLRSNAAALRDKTGIDLHHLWSHNLDELAAAWRFTGELQRLRSLVTDLREAADHIEQTTTPTGPMTATSSGSRCAL